MTTVLVAALALVLAAFSGFLRPSGLYWLPALAVIGLIALAAAGAGAALGGALRRFAPVSAAGINVAIYLFFLSGGISVAAFLPGWIQVIAHFTPTFYGPDALEAAIFYRSTDNLGRDVAVLVLTAAGGLDLGTVSLRRRLVASF